MLTASRKKFVVKVHLRGLTDWWLVFEQKKTIPSSQASILEIHIRFYKRNDPIVVENLLGMEYFIPVAGFLMEAINLERKDRVIFISGKITVPGGRVREVLRDIPLPRTAGKDFQPNDITISMKEKGILVIKLTGYKGLKNAVPTEEDGEKEGMKKGVLGVRKMDMGWQDVNLKIGTLAWLPERNKPTSLWNQGMAGSLFLLGTLNPPIPGVQKFVFTLASSVGPEPTTT